MKKALMYTMFSALVFVGALTLKPMVTAGQQSGCAIGCWCEAYEYQWPGGYGCWGSVCVGGWCCQICQT